MRNETMKLKCRLCSSDSVLISLFNSKRRTNRDYIRKLVEITTGIKFEKDDKFECICYSCTIQVYNFYIFRSKSIENERALEADLEKVEEIQPNKYIIRDLDSIPLPDVNELQDSLQPWLISKQQCFETIEDADCDETCETVEKSTQYDVIENVDVSIQCDTSNIVSKCDKYTECVISTVTLHTQTNSALTRSCKVQCCLLKDPEKVIIKSIDDGTQTENENVDKSTQHNGCEDTYDLPVKEEQPQISLLESSLVESWNITLSPNKNDVSSPVANGCPPSPGNLLTVRDTYKKVKICKHCDQTFYSRGAYETHKKTHMRCNFCKKKFISIKRTKLHVENDCDIRKLIKLEPVVQLVRLENLKKVQTQYPRYMDDFMNLQKRETKVVLSPMRIRSRSTSSLESFYSCCSMCRCSVTILHDLKLGVDKSVQTNSWSDNGLWLGLVNGAVMKSKFGNEALDVPPCKKFKVANSSPSKNLI